MTRPLSGGKEPNPADQPACIECRNVWKIYGKLPREVLAAVQDRKWTKADLLRSHNSVVAVSGVDLSIRPGEIFCVMGLSGSGKSTLVRCLNGLVAPTIGSVRVLGHDLPDTGREPLRALRSKRIAMVFQRVALLPHRTVLGNAGFGLELRKMPERERESKAQAALEMVKLSGWEHKFPDELSGGMQQRVGLARAIAGGADILLMDEPFSALDPIIRRELQEQFRTLAKTLGATVVFITHDFDEAVRLGDRIAIMKDGEIVQVGTPQQIVLHPGDGYVASFAQEVDRAMVLRARDVMLPPAQDDVRSHAWPGETMRSVEPDCRLDSLIELGAESPAPILVMDRSCVIGVITQQDLLSALRKPPSPEVRPDAGLGLR